MQINSEFKDNRKIIKNQSKIKFNFNNSNKSILLDLNWLD